MLKTINDTFDNEEIKDSEYSYLFLHNNVEISEDDFEEKIEDTL